MKTIYMNIPDHTGVGYYRSVLPSRFCAPILAKEKIKLEASEKLDFQAKHDVYIFHRAITPQFFPYFLRLRDRPNTKIVFELDDDLYSIAPSNPARNAYTPEILEGLRIGLELCDHIIVSTEPLKQALGHPAKTTVLENLVDPSVYRSSQIRTRSTILWAGSPTHADDLELVVEPIRRVLEACRGTDAIFFGMGAPEGLREHPQVTSVPFAGLADYPKILCHLNPSIALLPLAASKFNESKSKIKFFEMSLAGAVCVASPVGPYTDLKHCAFASDANEWVAQIMTYLDYPVIETCGKALKYVHEEYCWREKNARAQKWVDFFRGIVE